MKGLHTAETRTLNNPDLPSPYPAGAQLFFRAVTAIHESTFAMKVAFVVCEFAIVFVLLDVLRFTGQGQRAHLVLAFAWNPLLAIEVAEAVTSTLLAHDYGGVRRCAGAPMASDCGGRTWTSYSSEISAGRTLAPLLEAGSHSRRWSGGSRGRTPVRCHFSTMARFRSARWERMCRVSALMVRCLRHLIEWRLRSCWLAGSARRISDCNLDEKKRSA